MVSNTMSARADRASNRFVNIKHLECLKSVGFKTNKFSEYHYRIDNSLDVWTTNDKWHCLKTGERGSFTTIIDLILVRKIEVPSFYKVRKLLHLLTCKSCWKAKSVKEEHQNYIHDFIL